MTVSIGRVGSAGGAASYFASDNYYTAEQAETSSQWAGQGAQALGLQGRVDTARFEAILDGRLPDGSQVGDPNRRDYGRDFTFSMPKSASLLALVSGDKQILDAHMQAVKDTMKWAEANLAQARIKVDGKDVAVNTGNLVFALFPHDTSRATDPQSHIHAVIANLTQLPPRYRNDSKVDPLTGEVTSDQGWRAWHNGAMYRESAFLTSMTNAAFREKLEQLGYRTELTGQHGAFEVLGPNGERIAKAALDGFSKRSADIKAKAEELGIHSPQGRREITQRTRDPKIDAGDRGELLARWRDEAKAYGYNGDAIVNAALEASRDRNSLVERGTLAVSSAIRDTVNRLGELMTRPEDPLVDKGLARLTMLPATARTQYATASAVRILGEREAAYKATDVIKHALDLGLKGVTQPRVEARIDQLIRAGELVKGEIVQQGSTVQAITTREAIEQERSILKAIDAGSGQGRPLMPADMAAKELQALAGDRQLNSQQLAAAVQIVSSQDRVVLVQGRAGAGKSTMLQPVAKAEALDAAARAMGQHGTKGILLTADMSGDAKALAFQNKMVADLRADTGLEALTVHSFISRNEPFLREDASGQAFAARKAELQGSYLILDEASMISNAQMDKLLAIANRMEVGRLAIVGDRKQLNPIDSGKAFSLMQARALRDDQPINAVNINMRQRNDAMRLVADLADAGDIKGAFAVLGPRVVETTDRIVDATQAWLALPAEARATTTVLPSSREARAQINAGIQQGLLAERTLKGESRTFNVREQVNLTREELRYAQFWKDARILEVGRNGNSLNLPKGDYHIDRIYGNGRIGLVDMQGGKHRIDPSRISPAAYRDGFRLAIEKPIAVHEGERIRWTDSDKQRGMLNATIATVEKVSASGIVVRLANGEERTLANGDPMLKRMDLAYAINTHMAQGMTNAVVFAVMGARETNLSNARSFLVNLTRQTDDVRLFTDDKAKLIAQLERNRGDKASALEATGELQVERLLAGSARPPATEGAPISAARHVGDGRKGSGSGRDFSLAEAGASVGAAGLGSDQSDRFGIAGDNAVAGGRSNSNAPDGPRGPDDGPGKGNGAGKAPPGAGADRGQSQPERDRSKGLEL